MTFVSPDFNLIFIPGLRSKPPTEVHREALIRCIAAGLGRVNDEAGNLFADNPHTFFLYPWTHEFYGTYRDFELDREAIDELLANPEPNVRQKAEIDSFRRRLIRLSHLAGDRVALLGRTLATADQRVLLSDARRYLRDRDGTGARTRAGLRALLLDLWQPDKRLIIIAHSFGSVIAYDTLWELSRTSDIKIDTFITIGSPLGTNFVHQLLQGQRHSVEERYPGNIRRWVNCAARGELTALYPRLRGKFKEMIDRKMVQSFEDRDGLYNHYYGARGLNVHAEYGYLINKQFARALADALLNRAAAQS